MAGVKCLYGEGKFRYCLYGILMRALHTIIISFFCKSFPPGSARYLY